MPEAALPAAASSTAGVVYTNNQHEFVFYPGFFSVFYSIKLVVCLSVASWGSRRFWGTCRIRFEYTGTYYTTVVAYWYGRRREVFHEEATRSSSIKYASEYYFLREYNLKLHLGVCMLCLHLYPPRAVVR